MKLKNKILWKRFGTKLVNFFLVTLLLGVVISCGNRKTNTSRIYTKSDSISVENKLILRQNIILNDIGSIKPLNSSKPMIIDGKEYFNATIEYNKSQFYTKEIGLINKNLEVKKDKIVKKKQVEKKDYTILYLGLLFIFLFFVFLYFYLPTLKFNYMKK